MAALLGLLDFFHAVLASVTGIGAALVIGGAAFAAAALGVARRDATLARFVARSARVVAIGGKLAALGYLAHVALTIFAVQGSSPDWIRAVFEASFFRSYAVLVAASLACAAAGARLAREPHARGAQLAVAAAATVIALGGAFTSHAAGWLGERAPLYALDAVHRAAAYAWLGGVAHLVLFGFAGPSPADVKAVLPRAGRLFAGCVGVLVALGTVLAIPYLGSLDALVGTSYGALLVGKLTLLAALLGLAAMNHRSVSRVARGGDPPALALWRFAEIEVGLGIATLLVAATLASTPPGVDVGAEVATAGEVAHVFTQGWRDLAQLGSSGFDIGVVGVSVFNHRFAGLLLLAMALLAIAERAGVARWARNWPLLMLVLGVFVGVHADRQAWPFGRMGFVESFADPEIIQHRGVSLLGGAMLVLHSHAGVGIKYEFLIQLTHLPIAILGVLAGASRWLELRLPGREGRALGWIWPPALLGIGLVLVGYWEPQRATPDPRDAQIWRTHDFRAAPTHDFRTAAG
ncbi:MAG: putative Copper resistance protein copD family, partial [Deltaproteobacteria bacterium]|nr:putative Copper resistance protein copD family [Deltaproteobacteria bacterium]